MKNIIRYMFILIFFIGGMVVADDTTWTTGHYSNNANISHNLSISGASALTVTINGETENGYDYITIYNSSGTQVGRFSGVINETLTVSGSSIRAVLTSDGSVTKSGVTVSISTIQPPTSTPTPPPAPTSTGRTIIGKITYDKVHVNDNGRGLNYNNITRENVRRVTVKLVRNSCTSNDILQTTTTNNNGDYEFSNLTATQNVKICVYAELKRSGTRGYNVRVVDNTNNDALYTMQSSLFNIGENNTRRNLNASSGWNGHRYSSARTSAPFAILDDIYQAIQKVKSVDSSATFPELKVNWSIRNTASGEGSESELRDGLIMTSHYDGNGNLYILGDENSDTDEFDNHVIIHEWGHYFEDKFSRSDSIGGSHGEEDRLDIRVAFGEGWGNAWSAIATDDPIYFDTQGSMQSNGWYMDIENDNSAVKGFFSEDSIQHILYDIYDSHNDGEDRLSLGFEPIYNALIGFQKNTQAFTSIFTFIAGLQQENPSERNKIDEILNSEDIQPIVDIYGSSQSNLYSDMGASTSISNICTSGENGTYNKLNNHKYIKFRINNNKQYTINIVQNNGNMSDPDFGIYKTSPFEHLGDSDSSTYKRESGNYSLESGNYLLDISDYNAQNYACFDINID